MLQVYILIWTVAYGEKTGVNPSIIAFSLLAASIHASIEICFINLEA
jgi:hypothetical protein